MTHHYLASHHYLLSPLLTFLEDTTLFSQILTEMYTHIYNAYIEARPCTLLKWRRTSTARTFTLAPKPALPKRYDTNRC